MGADIVTVSTDTQFVHLAVSRMFGVYNEANGLDLRGTFLINPEGKLMSMEMHFYNVGRNIDELMRKFKANIYVSRKTNEVCPSKWKDTFDCPRGRD
jgi:NADH-dependent peroxiredoxin subunit C